MKVTVHFDGACSTKRNIAAGAGVVFDEAGVELGYSAKFLTACTTPVAEYIGLSMGLRHALALGATEVSAWGDAELIVRQVNGIYRCQQPHLIPLFRMVWMQMWLFDEAKVSEFPKAGPRHKRRWGNARADEIAGKCMESGKDLLA